jgi:hypothetical protein
MPSMSRYEGGVGNEQCLTVPHRCPTEYTTMHNLITPGTRTAVQVIP